MAQTTGVALAPLSVERPLDGRLGLNVPAGWWPTAASLKSFEAAGYGWVQVHSPPRATLTGSEAARHAAALRAALDVGALRLVLHAPDDLLAAVGHHPAGTLSPRRPSSGRSTESGARATPVV